MKRADGGMAAGSAIGAIGVALTALTATLCCAGPAVFAVVGAGGAMAAVKLEPYRPYFLAASIAMLAFGFWRAYRPASVGESGGDCSIRTGRVVRGTLWAAGLITLFCAIAPRFF